MKDWVEATLEVPQDFFIKRIVDDRGAKPVECVPVSIGTPFYNPLPFIDEYFTMLFKLDYPRELISLYWTYQGDDESDSLLYWFKEKHKDDYEEIKIKKFPLITDTDNNVASNVVRNRNWMIDKSKRGPLLFIDHDNFPPPRAIKRLLEGLQFADIVGGVYPMYSTESIGFTSFFKVNGLYYHVPLSIQDGKTYLPTPILARRRLYANAVGTGTCMADRRVLDSVRFEVHGGMTEDIDWCIRAGEKGYKIISDYGLMVPHWGIKFDILGIEENQIQVKAYVSNKVIWRRQEMDLKGVYVHE